jgi:hypothetical protein
VSSEADQLIDLLAAWVCDDCAFARENDEWPEMQDDDTPWPWSLFTEAEWGHRVAPSNVSNWVTRDDVTDQVIEGFQDFATSACKGCGTTLAGSRWRYAVWPTP